MFDVQPLSLWAVRGLTLFLALGLMALCSTFNLPEITLSFAFLAFVLAAWQEGIRGLRWILPLAMVLLGVSHRLLFDSDGWLAVFLGGLAGLLGLTITTLLLERARRVERSLDKALKALELGSTDLARANLVSDVHRMSVHTLSELGLAKHVAFVRWDVNNDHYQVLRGIGHFARLEGSYLPNAVLSEFSSLKDSWNAPHFVEGVSNFNKARIAAVPVTEKEYRPLGTLLLAIEQDRDFLGYEKALIGAVARLAGSRIAQQNAIFELEEAYRRSLYTLGIALEYRDFETEGHTLRVTDLSTALATHMGLSGRQIENMRQGAYLHDVGKLTISDQVLLKAGKFTPEERQHIETHVITGHRMLQNLTFLENAVLEIVRHHHERWDGAGYPDKLASEDIPLLARVFSVVDVYDALTSSRPYKRAWTPQEALEEIRKNAGSQFDPQVVMAFCSLMIQHTAVSENIESSTLSSIN